MQKIFPICFSRKLIRNRSGSFPHVIDHFCRFFDPQTMSLYPIIHSKKILQKKMALSRRTHLMRTTKFNAKIKRSQNHEMPYY